MKKVIGVDVVQSRLEVAKSYGIDHVFMPDRPEPGTDSIAHAEKMAQKLKKECGLDEGADVVLECSGAEPCVQMGVSSLLDMEARLSKLAWARRLSISP